MALTVDERLAKLEQTLGLPSGPVDIEPVDARVEKLVESFDKVLSNHKDPSQQSSLSEDLSECQRLGRILEPTGGILASAASSNSTLHEVPYIYRRQEILAQYDQLRNALEQLATMKQWLSASNPQLAKEIQACSAKEGEQISMKHVNNSPIFNNAGFQFAADASNQLRVEEASKKIVSLNEKAMELMNRCDLLIEHYYTIIKAVNEKLLLLQESI